MDGILRMVAMVLLMTVACAMAGAQDQLLSAAQESHPAGCHGHPPVIPTPVPTSYQCCVNGHHAAIPIAAFSLESGASQICGLDRAPELVLKVVPCFRSSVLVVPSSSPPGVAPLRI